MEFNDAEIAPPGQHCVVFVCAAHGGQTVTKMSRHAEKFAIQSIPSCCDGHNPVVHLLVALDQLNAWGVSFASVQERVDFTTPWGKLTLTVLGMLAEIYIDNLRRETRKGKHQRVHKGLYSHCTDPNGAGYCPDFGTVDKTDGKVLIPHPIDSVAVRLAYEAYATGDYSDATIADLLNAYEHHLDNGRVMHFRLKPVPGRLEARPFSADAARGLLQRVIYTGQVVYYGSDGNGDKRRRTEAHDLYPGQQSTLIDQATFDRVQELALMLVLGGLIALSTLLFRNFFAVLYGVLAAAAMFFSAYRVPGVVNFYLLRFIAIASCLYALLDIRSDLFTATPAGSGFVNDAVALSRLTGIPAFIWAGLWLIISLALLAFFRKRAARVQGRDDAVIQPTERR